MTNKELNGELSRELAFLITATDNSQKCSSLKTGLSGHDTEKSQPGLNHETGVCTSVRFAFESLLSVLTVSMKDDM